MDIFTYKYGFTYFINPSVSLMWAGSASVIVCIFKIYYQSIASINQCRFTCNHKYTQYCIAT